MSSTLSKEKKQWRESMKENNIQEIWKDIPGYEGHYQASNLGRIRSFKCNKVRILKPGRDGRGYCIVRLYLNNVKKSAKVHRLVWTAFNGAILKGLEINHRNEKKDDNSLVNLELVTRKENMNYGTRTKRASEKCCKCIQMLDKNNNILKTFNSLTEAAHFLNKNKKAACSNISKCLNRYRKSAYGYNWKFEA